METRATKRRGDARYWEIDAARGVAILMMAVYHTAYDLDTFGGYGLDSTGGLWSVFADLTATTFLFLVGVSLAVSYARDVVRGRASFVKYLWRGARVFGYGMLLTVVFYVFGMGYVVFGILHLIGVSVILAYPLLRFRWVNLALGVGIFLLGLYVTGLGLSPQMSVVSALGLPFGVVPEGIGMPDYRPLLPWFGVVLVGVFAGKSVYRSGRTPFPINAPAPARLLTLLGRHSLVIYLVHQPVIILLLSLTGIIDTGFF